MTDITVTDPPNQLNCISEVFVPLIELDAEDASEASAKMSWASTTTDPAVALTRMLSASMK